MADDGHADEALQSVRVGNYAVEGRIGAGASGVVYRARTIEDGRLVSLKVLSPVLAGDPSFVADFRAEAATMARIDSPHCVRFLGMVEEQGVIGIVSELVDGASLRVVLEQHGPLTPAQVLGVVSGALEGLGALHDLGIVHRDIKPANILVDRAGVSRLVDFGLARPVAQLVDSPGNSVGSPAYMSPEQALGDRISPASDVYSCGAMLFELLTGRLPFTAPTPAELVAAHASAPVPDPRHAVPAIPEMVGQLIMQSLAKDPSDRPRDAHAFLSELRRVADAGYPGWTSAAGVAAVVAAALGSVAGLAAAVSGGTVVSAAPTVAGITQAGIQAGAGSATVPSPSPTTSVPSANPPPAAATSPQPVSLAAKSSLGGLLGAHPVVAVVVAVAVIGGAAGGAVAASSGGAPAVPKVAPTTAAQLAKCITGTWREVSGKGIDLWSTSPVTVLTKNPPALQSEVRYNSNGTYVEVDPRGAAPGVGRLNGAVFYDYSFGNFAGHWRAVSGHEIVTSDPDTSHWSDVLYAGYDQASSPGTLLDTGTIPETVKCSATRLTYVSDVTHDGKKLPDDGVSERLPLGTKLETGSALFSQTGLLGGVNFDGYCQALGFSGATTSKPLLGAGAATDNWECTGSTPQNFDMDNACEWTVGNTTVIAKAVDSGAAFTWMCYKGTPPYSSAISVESSDTYTVQPTSPQSIVTVVTNSGCPSGSDGFTVAWYDGSSWVSYGKGSLASGQPIDYSAPLSSIPGAAAGAVRLEAFCTAGTVRDFVFEAITLTVEGPTAIPPVISTTTDTTTATSS